MARKSSKSKSGGSTMFGLLAGVIIGLAAAVAVALFVTKAPMPFFDKASRDPAQTLLPGPRDAPDPNQGLYGKNGGAGMPSNGPLATAPTPLPGTTPGQAAKPPQPDQINELIASLKKLDEPAPVAKSGNTPTVIPGTEPPRSAAPAKSASTQTLYYLQAGAFRSVDDAEARKAQVLLLGLPAQVQQAKINGGTINRVRVGPFKGIDEMNRSRAMLGEAKIESSVVRP